MNEKYTTQQKAENEAAVAAAEKRQQKYAQCEKDAAVLKKWLSSAWRINQNIMHAEEMIELWRGMAGKITTTYGDVAQPGAFLESKLMKYLCQIYDKEKEVERGFEELVAKKLEISDFIKKLQHPQSRELLEARYIMCKSWELIAEEWGYTEKYVRDILFSNAIAQALPIFLKTTQIEKDRVQ